MSDNPASPSGSSSSNPETPDAKWIAEQRLEAWKKAVDVQQHFNDIGWRIRTAALTFVTFALGASAVAAKDGTRVGVVPVATLISLFALGIWWAFYFVDRYWYHPLLKGAGFTATGLEMLLEGSGIQGVNLAQKITRESHLRISGPTSLLVRLIKSSPAPIAPQPDGQASAATNTASDAVSPQPPKGISTTSTQRLISFYRVGTILLLASAAAFCFSPEGKPTSPTSVTVNCPEP